jgi:hypothetical protein
MNARGPEPIKHPLDRAAIRAVGIELGATDGATGGEHGHPLTAPGTEIGIPGPHSSLESSGRR